MFVGIGVIIRLQDSGLSSGFTVGCRESVGNASLFYFSEGSVLLQVVARLRVVGFPSVPSASLSEVGERGDLSCRTRGRNGTMAMRIALRSTHRTGPTPQSGRTLPFFDF